MASIQSSQSKDNNSTTAEDLLADFKGLSDERKISISQSIQHFDYVTAIGLFLAFSLISLALIVGGSPSTFFNIPALLIVLGGTCAVTAISYSPRELSLAPKVLKHCFYYTSYDNLKLARELLDLSSVARIKGPLSLNNIQAKLKRNPNIHQAMQLLIDDFPPQQIQAILQQDINHLVERHKTGIGILRRAADVAPAMGLIGTLVGLVQMLSQLSNPEAIGPAMAIALITTFYGAMLGTVILSPMAAKLEKNSSDEIMVKDMILKATVMIASKEHPGKIETYLNTLLPPQQQIRYFD